MAKRKSRRPNLPEQVLARARAELYSNEQTAISPEAAPATPVKKSSSFSGRPSAKSAVSIENLRTEYAYVLKDLRSMALLAGLLIIGLVVASLILI